MKRLLFLAAALAAAAACGGPAQTDTETPEAPALTVFHGGTIYTGLDAPRTVAAVIVGADGRILETLAEGEPVPDGSRRIDLSGAVMLPGFTDAHVHLSGIGQREMSLDLSGTDSIAALAARVEAAVAAAPDGAAVVGRGWIETGWPEGRMPVAADIDPVSGNTPVLLTRADGHALLANTAALSAAGITNDTPDPDGGLIERDAGGVATGLLVDTAMALVAPLTTEPGEAERLTALATGAALYARRGWTGVHNMSVPAQEAAMMERLDLEGRLPLRVHNAFVPEAWEIARTRAHETGRVTNRAVKIYMDGALGSRGALLAAPYADRPGITGLALRERGETVALMQRAEAAGVQLAIHAIGDLANRRAFDWYEEAVGAGRGEALRWRIEHAQVIAPQDVPRMAELGLVASMQPSHAIGDLKFAPDRLGMARLAGAYAWNSLLEAGTVIAGGSDAPVEVGSPLIEFYAAVARKDLEGQSGPGWHPEEALSREDALALFTTGPAYAAFQEADLGTIEPGKLADFSVFDRDLMRVPEADILTARAVMTVVGGEIAWQAD